MASLLVAAVVLFFYIQPLFSLETVAANGTPVFMPYYGLVFYGSSPVPVGFPWARLQGLSGESGSFALAILPAYFWFLLVERNIWKLMTVVLGLVLTLSFGVVVFFLLVTVLSFRTYSWKQLSVHILSALMIIALPALVTEQGTVKMNSHYEYGWPGWVAYLEGQTEGQTEEKISTYLLEGKVLGKLSSLGVRIGQIQDAMAYLLKHPLGTGMAHGMVVLHEPVAMGYALTALESGWIGGVAYLLLFLLLAFVAMRSIKCSKHLLEYGDLEQVLAFSVLALLFFGAQRMQPDLSFWQMWIYAMFIWILIKSPNTEGNSC